MQYSQMAKYKQYDLQLDQYLLKDEFRKEAMYIIGSQKAYKQLGDDIFRNQDKRLPGSSPIAAMIKGHNRELSEKQFKKNFAYLDQLNEKYFDDDIKVSELRLPTIS